MNVFPRLGSWGQCGLASGAGMFVAFLMTVGGEGLPAGTQQTPTATEEITARVERGRYLVHDVAQCIQCHTARDSNGRLIMSKLLQGAPIPVRPTDPTSEWAFASPWIAGLANYDEATVLALLQHGQRPDGYRPKSPMPTFRMTEEDATAVVAYLRSL